MDSYRETTIISEDDESSVHTESEGESSDDFLRRPVDPPRKRKGRRRIVSDSESENENEDDSKNSNVPLEGEKTTKINTSDEDDSETEEENYDEEEDDAGDFEKDFMANNQFNSTAFIDLPSKMPEVPPADPDSEEEKELIHSIYEQATNIRGKSFTNSGQSKSSMGGSTMSFKKEHDETEIINSTDSSSLRRSMKSSKTSIHHDETEVRNDPQILSRPSMKEDNDSIDSIKIVEASVEEIIISDSDDNSSCQPTGTPQPTPFRTMMKTPTVRQPTIPEMMQKIPVPVDSENSAIHTVDGSKSPEMQLVSRMEYLQRKQNLENLNLEKRKLDMAMRTIQLNQLPDKGRALLNKQAEMEDRIRQAQEQFGNTRVKDETVATITWGGLEDGTKEVQPRTFGKQAMQTYNNEKALTLDRLHNLHASLKSCPTPDTFAEDPEGLKVTLMPHQKHAVAWLLWREMQKPAGGILADDMGLGKTLTMISLIVAHNQMREEDEEESENDENEDEEDQRRLKYTGGTLVVCPASLLGQWTNEVEDKLRRNTLSVETYHGPKRETKAKRLSKYDMVVTTYAICVSEGESDTPLYRIKWDRIILDEAHQIRNHKAKTALAVFRLAGKRRWALTGTPVHNKEMDLFALLKFLRCSPFDDVAIFKRWISAKSGGGHERLHTVLSSMLLRRTKEQLKEMEQLTCLPEREWQLLEIQMDKDEMDVYQKILLFSKTLFAQYLHQRAEKNADAMEFDGFGKINDPSNEYYKMHKKLIRMNKLPEVKQSDILVLLLRLRQICCHPSLITAMLDSVADLGDEDGAGDADASMDLLDQLNKLNIDDHDNDPAGPHELDIGAEGVGLAEASRNFLNRSNPVFKKDRQSAKVREVMKLLKDTVPEDEKVIIVSQWTSLLHLMIIHLDALNYKYCQLDGTIPVKSRGEIVRNFNDPNSGVQIMLLSLTAGGVGLNLVGANHLIFMDLHWNPQLEMQAQDRIYRVGQRKKVHIYKFMTVGTIEQRIKCLQDKKKEIADAMLKGAKMNASKLTMNDLKMLFDM